MHMGGMEKTSDHLAAFEAAVYFVYILNGHFEQSQSEKISKCFSTICECQTRKPRR